MHTGGCPRRRFEDALGAQVVLHIARTLHGFGVQTSGELRKNLGVTLSRDIGQHIKPSPVRHANGHLIKSAFSSPDQHGIQQWNQGLATLKGEPLLPHVLGLQEHFKCFSGIESVQDAQLLVMGEPHLTNLKAFLHPAPLLAILQVHVLRTYCAAVRIPQQSQHRAQRGSWFAGKSAGGEGAVQVPQGETVVLYIQVRVTALLIGQGISVGHEVTAGAVGVNEFSQSGWFTQFSVGINYVVSHPPHRLIRNP